MSLQCQYVVGLHRDGNSIKNRYHQNIACPLGNFLELFNEVFLKNNFSLKKIFHEKHQNLLLLYNTNENLYKVYISL